MTAAGDIQCAYHGKQLLLQTAAKQAQQAQRARLGGAVRLWVWPLPARVRAGVWAPKILLWLSFAVQNGRCGNRQREGSLRC